MATIPKQAPSQEREAPINVADLGDSYLVRIYAPSTLLPKLVGRVVTGIEPHSDGGNRMVPTFATEEVERNGQTETRTVFLRKWFAFVLPKTDGVYHLSARGETADAVQIENTYVLVENDGASLRRLTYPQLIEHFGGEPMKRSGDGTLVPVEAATQAV